MSQKDLDAYLKNRGVDQHIKERIPKPLLKPPQAPPPPPREVSMEGVLYVRPPGLGMPTICPKSMSWLVYLKLVQTVFPEFGFEIEYINDDTGVPRFETAQDSYDLERFAQSTRFSLEPRRTDEQDSERQRKEQDILNTIDERKKIIKEHLVDMVYSFLYGCSLLELPQTDWVTNLLQERIVITNDAQQLQAELLRRMDLACQSLSDLLGEKCYFMEDLKDSITNYYTGLFGKGSGTTSVTIVDVETAAISMLIMKCFENAPVPFNTALKDKLKWHISLWALGDRLYSIYMKPKVQVYSRISETTPLLIKLLEGPHQAAGSSGLVYRVNIEDPDNVWKLPQGEYAFKVQTDDEKTGCYETEKTNLSTCPYENVVKLIGSGLFKASVDGSSQRHFIVTKWEKGGTLETNIADLTWDQAKKVLKTLAYGLYMVHKTAKTVIMDLKPANVLLNESFSSIICDLGSSAGAGAQLPGVGTPPYNDSKSSMI